jgi:AraC family transcriptional regulator
MRALADTIASVGAPVFMQSVGAQSSPSAVVARFRYGGGRVDIGASDVVQVTFNLQDGVPVRRQTGNAPSRAWVTALGSVSMIPAHQRTQIEIQGQADNLQIFLPTTFLEHAVEGDFSCSAFFNLHDSELKAAAMQVFVAATRGEPDDALLLESGIRRLGVGLLRKGWRKVPETAQGGLARAARRRVDDLVRASLVDATVPPPMLAQLASAACLSVNHFIRAFHQQTGVTPHRYVVLRRIEHSIALLKRPGKSVAEVADDVGFATPAHFIATFRRTMGVTPGAFRAAILG